MSNDLLKMADGFVMIAESLRALAGKEPLNRCADKTKDEKQEKQSDSVKKDIKEKSVTVEQIRSVLAEKSQAGKTAEIRELLQKYGAAKLSAVAETHYPALLADAEAL